MPRLARACVLVQMAFPKAVHLGASATAQSILMRSKAAVERLRAYRPPPFPLWNRLHVGRRAAVLVLLYADKRGDLRVVITMRAATLRSFSGMFLAVIHFVTVGWLVFENEPGQNAETLLVHNRPCSISRGQGRHFGGGTL